MDFLARVGACLALGWATAALAVDHVDRPAAFAGISPIAQELRALRETGTVLHLGAHPDDENTQLITFLSRGRGYRTGYLSLTRGDGGQNELGKDFGEKLGVARTQELLAARKMDGGRQFFTRAIDFGFSKSPEETLKFWNRDEVLADVVRVIRQFRPDVIVTRFPVPPGSGGHGHHTASAILAVEAFKRAADPLAYPAQIAEGLQPWQAKRVLWNEFGQGRGANGLAGASVKMDIGGIDPVTGESFGTIANRSRGMHKTQGLGGFSSRNDSGPNVQSFMLLAGEPATTDIMDGVDLTWARIPRGADIGKLIEEVMAKFDAAQPSRSVPQLLTIRAKLAELPADPLVTDKRAQLDHIIGECLGLRVETSVDRPEIVPGEKLRLHVSISVSDIPVLFLAVRSHRLKLVGSKAATVFPGKPLAFDLTGLLPLDTPLTQPYWLREEGSAGIFRVSDPRMIGRPESFPAVPLDYVFEVAGQTLVVATEPSPTGEAATRGNRRRLDVIPPVSMAFATEVAIMKPSSTRTVSVDVSAARSVAAGTLRLFVPDGWKAVPAEQSFHLAQPGDKARFEFQVSAPATASAGSLKAVATIEGKEYSNQREEVRYAHLPLQLLQPAAQIRAVCFDFNLAGQRIGYLPGAGDAVAECLEQMGYAVTMLREEDLTAEKLKTFDAVVLGVRSFNEHPNLSANLAGLMTYVEQGGTVVVQYNRPDRLKDKILGPYPFSIQGPAPDLRVTDENSPFTFLAPEHPALTTPNRLGPADFDGWIQERGAYFPSSWDETHYVPIIAFNDPGESPLKGSVLVARHGQGYYVYTGLAFFRQLPAGVPGAYRFFANLVSLGKSNAPVAGKP
ncbi:MAG: mca [Verrucomicrobia bacterium]|nr:mca [Verrucomicrobiota bacterium]